MYREQLLLLLLINLWDSTAKWCLNNGGDVDEESWCVIDDGESDSG